VYEEGAEGSLGERSLASVFGRSHSVRILLFLNRQPGAVMTKDVMEALGIRNWSTMTAMLQRLEEARLVTVENVSVGPYKSRAKLWRIEPNFGSKVAKALEEVERLSAEAISPQKPPSNERPGVIDIESAGEKLVTVVQTAVGALKG
jgi:DNA-binding MarR family transcriptional regulator